MLIMLDKNAKWICHPRDKEQSPLVPVFQKNIKVKPGLLSARMKITSHGVYESKINGRNVTDHKFTPGLTSYYYRIQVQEYDITNLLHQGENIWLTTVGDGWWRWNNNYGYRLAMIGQIELNYEKERVVIPTDETFLAGTGPVIKTDLQEGEIYDARLENMENACWEQAAVETEHTDARMILEEGVPVREKERFPGKGFRDAEGNFVVDFGQNLAGYVRMTLANTKPGQKIHMKHGELLDPEGKFSTANCDGGKKVFQENTYYCKGAEEETYTPHFSYAGFRYMLVEGLTEEQMAKGCSFMSIAVYSDMEETGHFSCSNELINRLVQNALWSQKGNFLDVPVDCPTRERNAWTGDAQIYVNTACYFMNAKRFFTKWLKDQTLEQYESGKVGITFPSTSSVHNEKEYEKVKARDPHMALAGPAGNGNIGEDSVGWGDSAVHLPYTLYLMYGGKTILENQYETAKKWVEYSLSCMKEENPLYREKEWYVNGDGEYIYDTKFHYGEWNEPLPPSPEVIRFFQSGKSPSEYVEYMAQFGKPEVATAYTARSCQELSHMAEVLGKEDDARKYSNLFTRIKECYNKYMIAEDGKIQKGHQAPYIRALALDLVKEEKKTAVLAQLKKELEKAGYHLNTGFLSTGYLLPTLVENGLVQEAFRILEQTGTPGWLHPVTVGATTIPEKWNGFDEFRDSLNHYSFGAVCQFLFEYVAGIRPDFAHPGFKEFKLQPLPGGNLTWAKGSYQTAYGVIRSEWKLEGDKFRYWCEIPEGTKAELILPSGKRYVLTEGQYKYLE